MEAGGVGGGSERRSRGGCDVQFVRLYKLR